MNDRSHPLFNENLFRPVFEMTNGHWLTGLSAANIALQGSTPTQVAVAVSCALLGMGVMSYKKAAPRVKLHMDIKYNDFMFMDLDEKIERQMADKSQVQIGRGFTWGPEHTTRVRELMRLSADKSEIKIPLIAQMFSKDKEDSTKKLGGQPYIHAVGLEKKDEIMTKKTDNLKGHTMIYGQVGTGKTTLLVELSTGALARDNTIVVIDPKNDGNWQNALKYVCDKMELPFYYFHPSKPSGDVVRIDAIGTYTKASEIASRLRSILPSGGDSQAFAEYAWSQFNSVAEGLLYIGEKPSLIKMHKYLFSERSDLVRRTIEKYLENRHGVNWFEEKEAAVKRAGGDTWLEQLMNYYTNVVCLKPTEDKLIDRERRIVRTMINYISSEDPSRYSMMMSTTKPLIEQLVSTPLDELLSPEYVPGADDHRPIITTKGVMDTGGVLYIALDSMSDNTIASVVSKMLISDINANAAERYNTGAKDPVRLSLFVDEAHSALNEPLAELMAMGRAAEIEVYISSQTLPDYYHKAGKEMAERLTGLCRNLITMSISDEVTKKFVSDMIGQTRVREVERKLSSGSSTESEVQDFSAGYAETYRDVDSDLFPPSLLSVLPVLQYMASFQDGSKVKGIVPILRFGGR